jgi:hypothetical protein
MATWPLGGQRFIYCGAGFYVNDVTINALLDQR